MTPILADAEIAFIKERRRGTPLPNLDVSALIHKRAAQINLRQKEVNQTLHNRIRAEQTEDPTLELQRIRDYRAALQKTCAASQQFLQEALTQRKEILERLASFQEKDWGGNTPGETLLSYLGAQSFSFGGAK